MTTTTPSEQRFRVTGMECAGCAASVQRAVEAADGVDGVSVSLADGLATVSGRGVEPQAIVDLIEGRGFGATPVVETAAPTERRGEIEVRQNQRERQWRTRAIVGLGLWIPMAILHWSFAAVHPHPAWLPWVMLTGATVVLATAGAGFYRSAWAAARRGTTNMDTLIAIGATTAYVYSLYLLATGGEALYFGEAAALLGIISLGHWLEARATARAGSAVRDLLELQPDEAERVVVGDGVGDGSDAGAGANAGAGAGRAGEAAADRAADTEMIASATVVPGDRIVIRPGSRVPVDGIVVEGASDIDEAVVSGEPLPVPKAVGATVVAGSLNTTGRLVVEATVDGRHTTVSRIADLVERAQTGRTQIQRLADRVCAIFVPAVLTIAALTVVGWTLIGGDAGRGVIAAVTVLIISCPCALGLATPMAVMVGAGAASRKGILIKSAGALEIAGAARRVVFDKTGTLTTGRPVVTRVEVTGQVTGQVRGEVTGAAAGDENDMLARAAAVERASEHPIARAIVDEATARGLPIPAVADFRAIPGTGVRGTVGGQVIEVTRDDRASCRVLADGDELGTITVQDAVRPDARAAVARLRAMGLDVRMLSGDRRDTALAVGREIGLRDDEIEATATPESKTQAIRALGPGTVMIGDGINDAAALAQADLGIAIASGTNIAIESADVVIPGSAVDAVPETIDLARCTLRTIRQNLFFAFLYNVLAIPAAAFDAFGAVGLSGPLVAAIAMGLSDVTVVGNALRLKRALGATARRRSTAP